MPASGAISLIGPSSTVLGFTVEPVVIVTPPVAVPPAVASVRVSAPLDTVILTGPSNAPATAVRLGRLASAKSWQIGGTDEPGCESKKR